MKIFLSGQKSFGAAVLRLLRERGHEITGVAAPQTDRAGETDKLFGQADARGYRVIDVAALRADQIPAGTELIVCAHSHAFVGRRTRDAAKFGAIGYHPSLLPRHRGRDAVRWAVKMGDPVTGGTVYWLDDNVDGGPIAAQEWCWVEPGTSASELWRKQLFPLGIVLIDRVIRDIEHGRFVRIPQNEAVATFEPALNPPRLFRPELTRLGSGDDSVTFEVETRLQREIAAAGRI
jgi:methionyl-tRNA formyltransferase